MKICHLKSFLSFFSSLIAGGSTNPALDSAHQLFLNLLTHGSESVRESAYKHLRVSCMPLSERLLRQEKLLISCKEITEMLQINY